MAKTPPAELTSAATAKTAIGKVRLRIARIAFSSSVIAPSNTCKYLALRNRALMQIKHREEQGHVAEMPRPTRMRPGSPTDALPAEPLSVCF